MERMMTKGPGRRVGALLMTGVLLAGGSAVGADAARGADDEVHTQTFTANEEDAGLAQSGTFTVPANATSVQVTVVGQQGGSPLPGQPEFGGAGGMVTVDLGTAYNGRTLDLLVGRSSYDSTGGGAYLAADDEFLAIAAGGGQGGGFISSAPTGVNTGLIGGAGGFADGTLNGTAGEVHPDYAFHGQGAVGDAPGISGYPTSATEGVQNGTVATVENGVITPGLGSAYEGNPPGGEGYAGGGGSIRELVPALRGVLYGTSGGGSSYLAPGLEVLSMGANYSDTERSAAYITFTWTIAADESGAEDPGSEDPGTDEPGAGEGEAPARPADDIVLPIVAG